MLPSTIEFSNTLKSRTKQFALLAIRVCQALPKADECYVIKRQLLRSATSVAANYRAACRARSGKEFYAKICIVVEEADETCFWIELLNESNIHCPPSLEKLATEATELLKIMAKIKKSAGLKSAQL
ncbi:four helix bundle protein [Roseivirga sp. BDSF3-8]|uniref:four helix bundle protein n=1 Tax=Roseivirga sp. BDSF3-8 TaxID=3241598 RepID=UPI0035319D11